MPRALKLLRPGATATTSRHAAGALVNDPPTMPVGLSADEQTAWAGLLAELAAVPGLISRADRGVVELACRLEPMARKAAIVVREKGSTLECFDKDGNLKFVQQRPEATFLLKTGSLLKSLYAELGLSPSGRSRVSVTTTAPPSKLDTFLRARHGA